MLLTLAVLLAGVIPTAPETNSLSIGLLWEKSIINDVSHLGRSLQTMANLTALVDVNVGLHDITDWGLLKIKSLVCAQMSSGTAVFIAVVSCRVDLALRVVVQETAALIVAVDSACGGGSAMIDIPGYLPFPPPPPGLGPVISSAFSFLSKWKEISLIYDEPTGSKFDAIMNIASTTNATIQAFKLRGDQGKDEDEVVAVLDTLINSFQFPRKILMVCSLECQIKVMKQAQRYDLNHNVQSHFKVEDQWLLVADRFQLRSLEDAAGWIDNIAIVVPLALSEKSKESLVEEVFSRLLDWGHYVPHDNTSAFNFSGGGSKCTPMESHLLPIVTQQLQVLPCLTCTSYEIVTLMYGQERRYSEEVATWSLSGLEVYSAFYPNQAYGLNGRHFLVSTNVWPPFVTLANNNISFQGLSIELLEEISRSANFTYNLTLPADGRWGGYMNGSWTGLVGQLDRKEVDLVVAPLSIQSVREMAVDFTVPYYNEYTTVLTKLPDPSATKWSLYISPFKWQVWFSLACSIPFAGVVIWLFTRLTPYYTVKKQVSGLSKLDNALLYAFGSMFTQGGIYLPTAQSGRFIIGFWWMFCIVVVATYSGNLIAFLTVSKPSLPFNTLEEMESQTAVKYGLMKDTAAYNELQVSHNKIYRGIWENIQKFKEEDLDVISSDHNVHIQKVLDGGYAYINDRTGFDVALSVHCEVQLIKESFLPLPYGIALQNNSAYVEIFSDEVTKVKEGGLITKWKMKWWPRQSFCSRGMVTNAMAVSLEDVQGAYYVLGFFLVIASITLFVEVILKCSKRSKKPPPESKMAETPETKPESAHMNGTTLLAEVREMKVWGIYRSGSMDLSNAVRDIYTNKEPMVDIFGRST